MVNTVRYLLHIQLSFVALCGEAVHHNGGCKPVPHLHYADLCHWKYSIFKYAHGLMALLSEHLYLSTIKYRELLHLTGNIVYNFTAHIVQVQVVQT